MFSRMLRGRNLFSALIVLCLLLPGQNQIQKAQAAQDPVVGEVYAWGFNFSGQLGDGSTTQRATPAAVLFLHDAVSIAAGTSSDALKADGTVWQWGVASYSPIQTPAIKDVTAISTKVSETVALKSDGTVWRWGTSTLSSPRQLSGLSDVASISCAGWIGEMFNEVLSSYAVTKDGKVWTWDASSSNPTPSQVSGLSDITAVAGGYRHVLALDSNGNVWAWGDNTWGELGDNTTTFSMTPVKVHNLSNVTAIAAGDLFSLARTSDGKVWAWGLNSSGQLGDNSTSQRLEPVQVANLSGITAIAAGESFSMALDGTGNVYAWGDNTYFQLGTEAVAQSSLPMQVSGLSGIGAIAAGDRHGLAFKPKPYNPPTPRVVAWGFPTGDGTPYNRISPVTLDSLTGVYRISGGPGVSIAQDKDGNTWAWGYYGGQLGPGDVNSSETPTLVPKLKAFSAVAWGGTALALKPDGTVWGWGWNDAGQLGALTGDTCDYNGYPYPCQKTPAQIAGLTQVKMVAVGSLHSLALRADGTVWTWGINYANQLGYSTATMCDTPNGRYKCSRTPTQVPGLSNVVFIAGGETSSYAITSDGSLWVWGGNNYGEFGDGTATGHLAPARLNTFGALRTILINKFYVVALKADGTVWQWGSKNWSSPVYQSTPVQVSGLTGITDIVTGRDYALALKSDGTLWAWGNNTWGQLGDAQTCGTSCATPVQVGSGDHYIQISAGAGYGLALYAELNNKVFLPLTVR